MIVVWVQLQDTKLYNPFGFGRGIGSYTLKPYVISYNIAEVVSGRILSHYTLHTQVCL